MKTLITICIVMLSLNLNAQWDFRQFNQDQLNLALKNSSNTIQRGIFFTALGIGFLTLGIKLKNNYTNGLSNTATNNTQSIPGGGMIHLPEFKGTGCIGLGGALTMIGIPLFIIETVRKNNIEIALAKFQPTGSINGIGLKINF
jgi:hypothetical protein